MKQNSNERQPPQGQASGFRSSVRTIRWISQIGFLILLVFLITGTVCAAFVAQGVAVSEPVGVLQLAFASISDLALVGRTVIIGSIVFVVTVILLGKAFCAWACPVGTIVDAFDTVLEKLKFRPWLTVRSPQKKNPGSTSLLGNGMGRYAVLASVLSGSALLKFPVWCVLCPIGTLCRGAVAGAEFAMGAQLLTVPAVGALSLGQKRFWCRYLCPVGGFLTLVARLNPFIKPHVQNDALHRDCGACKRICPEGIDICNEKSLASCTKCLDCYVKCPFGSVKIAWM